MNLLRRQTSITGLFNKIVSVDAPAQGCEALGFQLLVELSDRFVSGGHGAAKHFGDFLRGEIGFFHGFEPPLMNFHLTKTLKLKLIKHIIREMRIVVNSSPVF